MKTSKKNSFIASIGGKLIIISTLVILAALAILTVIAILQMSSSLTAEATAKLQAVQKEKTAQVIGLFEKASQDSAVLAKTNVIQKAIDDLVLYHEEMNISPTGIYDTTGSSSDLTNTYEELYSGISAEFQKYGDIYGYFDVFIICAAHGHVMYTNAAEGDLGANLSSGQYADSGLGQLWKKVVTEKKTSIIDLMPYAPSGGVPAMFIGSPVFDGSTLIGVAALQINNDSISALLTNSAGMGESGEVYAVGEDLLMRTESRFSLEGETTVLSLEIDTPAGNVLKQSSPEVFTEIFADYRDINVYSIYSHLGIDEVINSDFDWSIIAEIDESEVNAPINNLIVILVIIAAVIIAVAIVIMVFFSRSISIPLKRGVEIAEQIAVGNLDLSVESKYLNRADEIGMLSEALQNMITSLSEIVGSVVTGSAQIATASEELATGNQDLSSRTEQQASALEETSSAIEEMNSSVKSNADNTVTADKLSRDAVSKTDEGSESVSRMIESMNDISDSSSKIAEIIEVINNIAFQTNLLALNASIEAARAGEQGKGFAVVAVEVRKLAKRSDKAAGEIAEIIKNSSKKVEEGVDIANETDKVITEINGAVKKVTALISEVSAASQEQLSSVEEIDKTLADLDENTQKNAALVEEAASSTEELSAQAEEMNSSMEFFSLKQSAGNSSRGKNTKKGTKKQKAKPAEIKSEKPKAIASPKNNKQADGESYESFVDLVDEGEFDEF